MTETKTHVWTTLANKFSDAQGQWFEVRCTKCGVETYLLAGGNGTTSSPVPDCKEN